ncbi:MAG: biotin transporter BioY [Cryobacterium sp.]|nr:biotin transporter BioY [Oligoflexia bacterium]
MMSQAFVPQWISRRQNTEAWEIFWVGSGTLYLALLAQISFSLPFTPVPITGQTFGVATLALLWGGKRTFAVVGIYLLEGAIGLPVFADFSGGLEWGPTLGYLIGMLLSGVFIGVFTDHGLTNTLLKAWLFCSLGSAFTFLIGLFILHFFIPFPDLLAAGLFPFLPGDILKNFAAALAVTKFRGRKPQ